MTDKKTRKIAINIHINEGEDIEGIWSEKEQSFSLRVKKNGSTVNARKVQKITYYDRSKKPKILNKQEFNRAKDFTLNEIDSIKKYSQLWSIDTNHKDIFGHSANVSVITVCATNTPDIYYPTLAIIFGEVTGNPELFAWRKFIEFTQKSSQYSEHEHYGLVVDSELSLISDFNEQARPIHGDFFLPTNWKLVYATSDSGKENTFNRLIAASDKAASELIKLIATKESNVKYWLPVTDEEKYLPSFLPLPPQEPNQR